MKDKLRSIGYGFIGMLIALFIWFVGMTLYNDHVILGQVVGALNRAAQQQQASQPTKPPTTEVK